MRSEALLLSLFDRLKSESEVAQPCPTLGNPMDCSPPGSSAHGIFQARVLECVGAIAFSEPILIIGSYKYVLNIIELKSNSVQR